MTIRGRAIAPKGERIWASYYNSQSELLFILTSKATRDFFFLYEVTKDATLKKLGKSRSPLELEEKYNVNMRIGVKGGG
jgi:hypothetical protein